LILLGGTIYPLIFFFKTKINKFIKVLKISIFGIFDCPLDLSRKIIGISFILKPFFNKEEKKNKNEK